MTRSNSPTSFLRWTERAPSAPYRASVGNGAHWDTDLPSPNLAEAVRVSPGGRLLLAFRVKEVRDFFVEGHAHQGAQAELDGCERATSRKGEAPKANPPTESLDEAISAYVVARKAEREADGLIERHFNDKIGRLLSGGEPRKALELLRSMPDNALRAIAVSAVMKSGLWNIDENPMWKVEPAPYDSERAGAMVLWQRASKGLRAAEDVFGKLAMQRARELLDGEGNEAVAEFMHTLPASVTKAFVADMARYGRPRDKPTEPGGMGM